MKKMLLLSVSIGFLFASCEKPDPTQSDHPNPSGYLKSFSIPWTYEEIETYAFDSSFLKESFIGFLNSYNDYIEDPRTEMQEYNILETIILAEAAVNHLYASITDTNMPDMIDTFQIEIQTHTMTDDTPFYAGEDIAEALNDFETSLYAAVGENTVILIDFEIVEVQEAYIVLRAVVLHSTHSFALIPGSWGNPAPFPTGSCRKAMLPGPCNGAHSAPPPSACKDIQRRLNPCQFQTGPPATWCATQNTWFGITYNGYSHPGYPEYLWGGSSYYYQMSTNELNYWLQQGQALYNDHGYHGVGPQGNWHTYYIRYEGFSHTLGVPQNYWLAYLYYGYSVSIYMN